MELDRGNDLLRSTRIELSERDRPAIDAVFSNYASSRLLKHTPSKTPNSGSGIDDELNLMIGEECSQR